MTNTIIKKFFLFFCILFAFDFLAGSVLKKLYSLQKRGTNFRTAYLIKECQADIVILGSSRASRHYATDVMSEISGLVCYNGGRDGTMFDYAYACASSILKRYHPKLIIIDLNLLDFYNSPSADEQLNSLLPYYNDDVEIKKK